MSISGCRFWTTLRLLSRGSDRLSSFKIDFENNPDPKLLNKIMDLFTESGLRRVEKLKNLSGLRFLRGFLGQWASGEGLVFEDFEPETHIVDTTHSCRTGKGI